MRAADDVKITGSAGLGLGPAVFYNRGTCSVQVRLTLFIAVAWLEWPLCMDVDTRLCLHKQAVAPCVLLSNVHPPSCSCNR